PGVRRSAVRDDVERRQVVRVAAASLHHRLTCGALKRGEFEDGAVVVREQELKKAAAKAADAVVENEMSAFGFEPGLRLWTRHALILMNMFTQNVKPRKRGRPSGQTAQGAAARDRLYSTAMRLIAERGYEATTLRDIARQANVSVGLLYRYFPSKQAVILAFSDELS